VKEATVAAHVVGAEISERLQESTKQQQASKGITKQKKQKRSNK